jgi:hypothetical protein
LLTRQTGAGLRYTSSAGRWRLIVVQSCEGEGEERKGEWEKSKGKGGLMCLNETYLNRKGITAPNSRLDTESLLFIFLHLSFFPFFSISLATKLPISFYISVIFYSDLNPINIILQLYNHNLGNSRA